MVLTSSNSTESHLPFGEDITKNFSNFNDKFNSLLSQFRQQHYPELYEQETDGTVSLEETLNKVLELFQDENYRLCHFRYVWMTLILALLVEPTLEYYQPLNFYPKAIINLLEKWLLNHSNPINLKTENDYNINHYLSAIQESRTYPLPEKLPSFQIINESIDVFYNAVRVLDYEQSKQALLDILDDCLEGYAVFPGSDGRRELFDWWLSEVVIASWYFLPPATFYIVEGLENREEMLGHQINKLEQISHKIYAHSHG